MYLSLMLQGSKPANYNPFLRRAHVLERLSSPHLLRERRLQPLDARPQKLRLKNGSVFLQARRRHCSRKSVVDTCTRSSVSAGRRVVQHPFTHLVLGVLIQSGHGRRQAAIHHAPQPLLQHSVVSLQRFHNVVQLGHLSFQHSVFASKGSELLLCVVDGVDRRR